MLQLWYHLSGIQMLSQDLIPFCWEKRALIFATVGKKFKTNTTKHKILRGSVLRPTPRENDTGGDFIQWERNKNTLTRYAQTRHPNAKHMNRIQHERTQQTRHTSKSLRGSMNILGIFGAPGMTIPTPKIKDLVFPPCKAALMPNWSSPLRSSRRNESRGNFIIIFWDPGPKIWIK